MMRPDAHKAAGLFPYLSAGAPLELVVYWHPTGLLQQPGSRRAGTEWRLATPLRRSSSQPYFFPNSPATTPAADALASEMPLVTDSPTSEPTTSSTAPRMSASMEA